MPFPLPLLVALPALAQHAALDALAPSLASRSVIVQVERRISKLVVLPR